MATVAPSTVGMPEIHADGTGDLDRLLPAGLSPEIAIARLVGLVKSLRIENAQLREALESRIAIEQAKGVLAERFSLDPVAAFEVLRRSARTSRVRLHDLAAAVVAGGPTPPEIQRVLVGLEGRSVADELAR